jgi:membrane protein DedA with SNARE-associated domain
MSEWLLLQSGLTIYIVLLGLLLSGALGFPPEDFTLILAGIVYSHGVVELKYLLAICYFGTIFSDLMIYGFGRWFGKAIFAKEWFRRRMKSSTLKNVRAGIEKRALVMIFVARHLFYLRTVTFISCGALRMSFPRFLIADCLSALVSLPVMLTVGYIASENYEKIMNWLGGAKLASLVIAVSIVALITYFVMRSNKKITAEKETSSGSAEL